MTLERRHFRADVEPAHTHMNQIFGDNFFCRGHERVTELLLESSANVNAKNKDRDTPMHWACSGGNVEVIRMLMHASADPLAKNSDNTTPLHFAAAGVCASDLPPGLVAC